MLPSGKWIYTACGLHQLNLLRSPLKHRRENVSIVIGNNDNVEQDTYTCIHTNHNDVFIERKVMFEKP